MDTIDSLRYGIKGTDIIILIQNLNEVESYMKKIGKGEDRTIYVRDEEPSFAKSGKDEDGETDGKHTSKCWNCRIPIDSFSDEKLLLFVH